MKGVRLEEKRENNLKNYDETYKTLIGKRLKRSFLGIKQDVSTWPMKQLTVM